MSPLLSAVSAAEMLSGDNENVRAAYVEGEELVQLSSRNQFPNNDLTNFKASGKLEGWQLKAHPRMDGYHAYARQLTTIRADGSHRTLRNTKWARQNTAKISLESSRYRVDGPLITGPPLPDADKQASIAPPGMPPGEAPRVRVVPRSGAEGYPAGRALVAFFWIIGNNPKTSRRRTSSGPTTEVELNQNELLEVFPPEEVPANVTGIGVTMSRPVAGAGVSPDATKMRAQTRRDIRREIPESIVMTGSYHADRPYVFPAVSTTTNPNAGGDTTYVGPINEHPPPKAWISGGSMRTDAMNVDISYQLRTSEGWTAAQGVATRSVEGGNLRSLRWSPPASAKRTEGVTGWRPLFRGKDGEWYTIKTAASYYALSRPARLYTNDTSKFEFVVKRAGGEKDGRVIRRDAKGWRGPGSPQKLGNRPNRDSSGVNPPDVAPEEPLPFGATGLEPGDYGIRLTGTVGEEQSAPTEQARVTLRDSGLAAGGPASGTTDRMIDIARPTPQTIRNARQVEKGPDDLDLNWSSEELPAVQVISGGEAGEGVLAVNDTSASAERTVVRATDPTELDTTRRLTVEMDLEVTRHSGGAVAVELRFLDANEQIVSVGGELQQVSIGRLSKAGERPIHFRAGPAEKPYLDYAYPPGCVYVQLVFINIGTLGGVAEGRDLRWEAKNIDVSKGMGGGRKRYPLDLDLSSDHEVEDRRSDEQDPAMPFPSGPYYRVVREPRDPAAFADPEVLASAGFEDGTAGLLTQSIVGATLTYEEQAAIGGSYGARARLTTSTGAVSRGGFSYPLGNVGSGAVRFITRLKRTDAGQITLAAITNTSAPDDWIARVYRGSAENLILEAMDGASSTQLSIDRDVLPTDKLLIELIATGAGSANGMAEALVWKNGHLLAIHRLRDLDWSSLSAHTGHAGVVRAPAGLTYDVHIDRVKFTRGGLEEGTALPGNYAEFWAPEGSRYDPEVGASGMRVPVSENTTYTFSAYLGCEGVTGDRPWQPFPSVVLDEDGNLLQANEPLASLKGDEFWDRHHITLTMPEGAAWVEFVGGGHADGLCRWMAPQFEEGSLTPYTNEHASGGFFSMIFDTSLPGGHIVSGHDAVSRYASGEAKATQEYDDGAPLTDVTTEWRTADSFDDLYLQPFNATLSESEVARYVQAKVTLSSTDPTATPGVRSVVCGFERPFPCLLRPDGSELTSGAWITQWTGVQPRPNILSRAYAQGSPSYEDYTGEETPVFYSGTVTVWREDARRELEGLRLDNEQEGLIVESFGRRYVIRPTGPMPAFEVRHEAHVALAAQASAGNIDGWEGTPNDFDLASAELEEVVLVTEESIGDSDDN